MSDPVVYCSCKRPITRAVSEAIRQGHFCPTCFLLFNPDASPPQLSLAENSFSSSSSDGPEHVHRNLVRWPSRRRALRTSDSNTDHTRNSFPEYDSVASTNTDTSIDNPPAKNMDLPEAFRVLAAAMSETGKFKTSPFSGAKDENITSFLKKFNRFCEINNKDADYKTQTLPLHLDGRAFTLYESLSDDIKGDYDLITEHMKNYFAPPPLPPLQAYERLHSLKMNPKDTVQDFYEKLHSYTKDIEIPEHQKMALFISGLPKHIKNFVVWEKPDSMAGALRNAKQRELVGVDPDDDSAETKKLLQTILVKLGTQKIENPISPKVSAINHDMAQETQQPPKFLL